MSYTFSRLFSLGGLRDNDSLFQGSSLLIYISALSACIYFLLGRFRMFYMGSMTSEAKADGCLIMCIAFFPLLPLINSFILPSYNTGKDWFIFTATTQLISSAFLDLPPSYQFLTWLVQCTSSSLLDFWQANNSMVCTSTLDLILTIAKHLCTRSILMFAVGLVNSIIPVLIFIKQRKEVACFVNGHTNEDSSCILFQPPLQSFGIDIRKQGPVFAILSWIDAKANELSGRVDENTIALSYYGSLMVAIFSYLCLLRSFGSLTDLPSESIMFSLLTFFMMGRQMSRLDVIPALEKIDHQLDQSHAVMNDLLPGFVVESLMNNTQEMIFDLPNEPTLSVPQFQLHFDPKDNPQDLFKSNHSDCEPNQISPILSPLRRQKSDASSVKLSTQLSNSLSHQANNNLSKPVSSQILSRPCSRPFSGQIESPVIHGHHQKRHKCVTVFFSDLVGFSTWSHTCDPDLVMATLDNLFSRLDTIIMEEMTGLYKVETVGDAYVVAANLIEKDEFHALTAARFALRAQYEASQVFEPGTDKPLQMRIGVHSSPVTAGIVGKLRKRYCMFGDTVNMAARTETSCPPGSVQLTEAAYHLLLDQSREEDLVDLCFKDRGMVEVKGADKPLHMFLVSNALEGCIYL